MNGIEVRRLVKGDRDAARATFDLMAEIFGEGNPGTLDDAYIDALLERDSF